METAQEPYIYARIAIQKSLSGKFFSTGWGDIICQGDSGSPATCKNILIINISKSPIFSKKESLADHLCTILQG